MSEAERGRASERARKRERKIEGERGQGQGRGKRGGGERGQRGGGIGDQGRGSRRADGSFSVTHAAIPQAFLFLVTQTNCKKFYSFLGPCINSCRDSASVSPAFCAMKDTEPSGRSVSTAAIPQAFLQPFEFRIANPPAGEPGRERRRGRRAAVTAIDASAVSDVSPPPHTHTHTHT